MKRFLTMIQARLTELLHDRSALVWNLLFAPMFLVLVIKFFSSSSQPLLHIGVLGDAPMTAETHPIFATEAVEFHKELETDKAISKVQHNRMDLLVDLRTVPVRFWINPESQNSLLARRLLQAVDPAAQLQPLTGSPIHYADWLISGLLSVNIMFSSLFAIGHVMVRYRKTGYLKRLNGTPLRPIEFAGAQAVACLLVIELAAIMIYGISNFFLHFRMEGSYGLLLLVTVLGSTAMITMSLLISARLSSEEMTVGLATLLSVPMVTLSGVFVSLDGQSHAIRALANLLPMTHMITAARAVMLDGAGLREISGSLTALATMSAIFIAITAFSFKWSDD